MSEAAVAENHLVPRLATVRALQAETGAQDVRTFQVTLDNGPVFPYLPGQCAMLSVLGVGESMISITSSPTRPDFLEFSVKNAGRVTGALHELEEGARIGVRGPYGNHFPLDLLAGKNLLFVAGGIGLAPLRSLIGYCLDHREDFGRMQVVYGARSAADLCFKADLFERWPAAQNISVDVTVDRGDDSWPGPVGFVPAYLESLAPSSENAVAITCGPPIMIKFVLAALAKLGFPDDRVVTTLELKMQCGVGLCGRCNIGPKYVCLDGPVFTLAELKKLPQEF